MRDDTRGFVDATTKRLPLPGQSLDYYEGYDRGLRHWFAALRAALINHTARALSRGT